MKKKIISFIVALALAATATFGVLPKLYESSGEAEETDALPTITDLIEINEENFPDENFLSFAVELEKSVAEEGAADGAFSKDELLLITSISINSRSVKNLKGIEFFFALETLDCSNNGIESLDLRGNKNLKELYCSDNKLCSLDLSGLQELTKLDCGYNELSELVLTENPMLTDLHLSGNPITELDLSGNPDLWRFEASSTNLAFLNIENHNPYDSENGMEFEQFELNGSLYTAASCTYDSLGFDLASLPSGFDVTKASGWKIKTGEAEEFEALEEFEGTVLANVRAGDTVAYTYEIMNGISAEFSISFTEEHRPIKLEDLDDICTTAAELWQCSECGKYFADENGETEVEVGEHSFGELKIEQAPNCTSEGMAVKTCTVCGHEEHEALAMLPHSIAEGFEHDYTYHWKICTVCGLEIEKEEHTLEDGEEDSKICLICGAEFQHRHTAEFIEEKAPTCTREGVKAHYFCAECGKYFEDSELTVELTIEDLTIEKSEHQYEIKSSEDAHWQQCIVCGEKQEETAHTFEAEITEPSCCQSGSVYNICHICGYGTDPEEIPATGEHVFGSEYGSDDDYHWIGCTTEGCTERAEQSEHLYTKLEITKEPTCSEEGIMTHICEVCGHSKTEAIEAVGTHTYGGVYGQLDENTHTGLCTVCGELGETEDHKFDEGVLVREASCQDGIIRYTCICGYTKDESIPAVSGHKYADSFEDLGDTHSAICSICGAASEPRDHDYNIEIVDPTCIESGKMVYTCKHCGHSYTEDMGEPTGRHTYSSEFTLDGDKHRHMCETEGCTAVDIHLADECTYSPPPSDPKPDTSTDTSNDTPEVALAQIPTIDVTWPTTAGVVLNPYKMKIKMTPSADGKAPVIAEDPDGKGETLLSNELSFINNGSCEVNVSVTGSVSAVTTVDSSGNKLVDSEGNPVTTPSEQIVIANAPIKQPQWDSEGTSIIQGDTSNSVFIYLEASDKLDATGKNGVYTGVYDSKNKNQMLLTIQETTKDLFSISAKEGSKAGVTNLKICGDISTAPSVGWDKVAKTDNIKIILVFDVSLVTPVTENPLPEKSDNSPAEESEGSLTGETDNSLTEALTEETDNSLTEEPESLLTEKSENHLSEDSANGLSEVSETQ